MFLLSLAFLPYAALILPLLYYILPWLRSAAVRDIPAPFPAAFTNLWLLWQARKGERYLAVNEAHEKLGPIVRIQPNHISVNDADAINIIYGHGNGFLKRSAFCHGI